MKLRSLAASFVFVLACSSVSSRSQTTERATVPVVEHARAPAAESARIAVWRAEGPAALDRLLADFDKATPGPARDRMAATIDKVAGQRYATWSRLYWYDDLDAAKAAARASGKPILSLRMLGRLDEDLSCANSRFFRTTLYPDVEVAKLLREHFILHWSSERNVPRVTVDFGDGRTLESTITGNSAHYILAADGHPLDVLPGLYSPQVFRRELSAALQMYVNLEGSSGRARDQALVSYHQARLEETNQRWSQVPLIQTGKGPQLIGKAEMDKRRIAMATAAQRVTVSKAMVEVPMMQTVDLGVDPASLPDDSALWVRIYNEMWQPKGRRVLDNNARALVDSLLATPAGSQTLTTDERARILVRLEQTIAGDTAINEARLRQQVRQYLIGQFAAAAPVDFASLNKWVYAEVFHAPATDEWMGLLPRDTFTGLPGGAVVATTH